MSDYVNEPRVTKCSCGNERISERARYCIKCGRPVLCLCTSEECAAENDAGARYCEMCGSPTNIGLWDDNHTAAVPNAGPNDVPF